MVSKMGSKRPPQFAILIIVETLQINLIQINPGSKIVEYLRSGVTVGDKSGN